MSIDPFHDSPLLQRARSLIMNYGWNSAAYQILNPGIQLWFSQNYDAVVGFVEYASYRVVAGAPVCAKEDLQSVLDEFESLNRTLKLQTCYFCAGTRLAAQAGLEQDSGRLILGAEPVWSALNFSSKVNAKASLRAQCSRARNKGVVVELWDNDRASADSRLKDCLRSWLETRALPPMHFLIESRTLERLGDRRVYVATLGTRVVGFSVISPIPTRNGWLVEQNIRSAECPNGTVELILHELSKHLAEESVDYFTLGLAPLSVYVPKQLLNKSVLSHLLRGVRAVAKPLYDFEGLDKFKAKFVPDYWEPIYALRRGGSINVSTLYAIAGAFSGGSPFRLVASGLRRILS